MELNEMRETAHAMLVARFILFCLSDQSSIRYIAGEFGKGKLAIFVEPHRQSIN